MKFDQLNSFRLIRRFGMVVVSILIVWAVSWLALPMVLKNQVQSRLSAQLGRQVSVGRVDFKPWSLELTLEDFAIAHATDASPQFRIKRLYIDLEMQSLFKLAPVAEALQLEQPWLQLKHLGGGHYDVDDVLARLNQPADTSATSPLGFALYNLSLTQGEVTLVDAPESKTHKLTNLTLKLPFLSSLNSQRHVLVHPHLAFELNGSPFDSDAESTPFADNRKTEAHFRLKAFDLTPYLAYLPPTLPLQLSSAVLNADVKLAFEQVPKPSVVLSGWVSASQVKLTAPSAETKNVSAQDLLAFDELRVQLSDVRPLERRIQLGQIDWLNPRLHVQRNGQGALNWQTLLTSQKTPQSAPEKEATKAVNKSTKDQNDQKTPVWTVAITQVNLKGGQVHWADDSAAQPARLNVQDLNLVAHAVQWPIKQPIALDGSARLETASMSFKGAATDQSAELQTQLTDVPLSLAAPYMADVLVPKLQGVLQLEAGLSWRAARSPDEPMQLTVQIPRLALDKLELTSALRKGPKVDRHAVLVGARKLQLEQVVLDFPKRTATLGRMQVTQPKAKVARSADGRWMFQDWWIQPSQVQPETRPQPPAPQPWQVVIQEMSLNQGDLSYSDVGVSKPVAFEVTDMALQAKNFNSQSSKPVAWSIAGHIHHGHTDPGSLAGRGSVVINPLKLNAELDVKRLPLHALQPYIPMELQMDLLRADASFKGHLELTQQASGMGVKVRGDTHLEDLRVDTLGQATPFKPAEEILSWKDLSLTGLDIAMTPGQSTRVDVAQTSLNDFYAKLTLDETGHLNLQDVFARSSPKPANAATTSTTLGSTPIRRDSKTPDHTEEISKTIAAHAVESSSTGQNDSQKSPAAVIHFGPVSLTGGRVDFTDRFIKPNYSARLSELAGKLSAFSSVEPNGQMQLADLELRGRAEGTASLEILGKVNPLAQPVALDIAGHVRDLELAPLSTYSVHYAGYGIERGKLSMDVAYKVQPDGQLTANNQLVLNQLKFGDEVPGAPNSLPVKLAVALLADRYGVIDINLPVSGSLNDPQFRLAPIVFKLIVNLVVKAITAPFSLLANAFGGGGDELSMVSFAPGSAVLSSEAKAGLNKVAQALKDRPGLKMTVVGTASLDVERDAFKHEQLQALVQAEKRRAAPGGAQVDTVLAQEYPALLKAVYKRANFPKPRNLIGMVKDLPEPEMQALLLANLGVSEAAMQELAVQRGVTVRDYLASLKLPLDRLFLGAAKAVPPEAKWRPRAELSLATQ